MVVKKGAVIYANLYSKQNFIAAFLKSCRRYRWRKDEAELKNGSCRG